MEGSRNSRTRSKMQAAHWIGLAALCCKMAAALPAPPAGADVRWAGARAAASARTTSHSILRLRGGLAGGPQCFGPTCGGRALPDVLGFGAWQASALNGGSSLYVPLAGYVPKSG